MSQINKLYGIVSRISRLSRVLLLYYIHFVPFEDLRRGAERHESQLPDQLTPKLFRSQLTNHKIFSLQLRGLYFRNNPFRELLWRFPEGFQNFYVAVLMFQK